MTYTYKKLTRLEFERIVFKPPKDSLLLRIVLKRKKIHIFSVTERLFIAEHQARESEAPYLRKSGYLSIWEILLVMWSYVSLSVLTTG